MKVRKRLIFYTTCAVVALGLLSACGQATSTPPPRPLCGVVLPEPGPWRQVWRSSEPAGVNDMLRDGDWLWIATPDDIVRLDLRTLDCARFSHTTDDPEVPLEGVRALLLDPEGWMWAGGGKRLAHFDGQKWQAVHPDLDSRCMYVHSLAFDAEGSLWITSMSSCGGGGGAGGGIQARYPGQPPVDGQWEGETVSGRMLPRRENPCDRWVATSGEFHSPEECWLLTAWRERLASLAPPEDIAPWGENPPIAAETGDRLWVLARHFPDKPYDALLSFDGQDWQVLPWPYGSALLVADEARGGVWLGTNEGLIFSDGQSLQKFPLSPGDLVPVGPAVYDLVTDKSGRLWASTPERGLLLYDEASDAWQPTEISEWVLISADVRGGLWAVSHSREGRVSHFDGETWSHHPFPKGWPCFPYDILGDVGGGLWLSSIECALRGFNGEVWDEYDSGSRGELLARGLGSDIYAATRDGAVKRGTKWETLLPADPLRHAKPLDLVVSQEGEIWVAFDAVPGLLVYRDGEWHEVQTPVDEMINALLIDSQGNLWVGYGGSWASDDSGGLLRYNGETWERISEWPGIVALAEDRRGRIWVGGRRGLSVYDPHWGAGGR